MPLWKGDIGTISNSEFLEFWASSHKLQDMLTVMGITEGRIPSSVMNLMGEVM